MLFTPIATASLLAVLGTLMAGVSAQDAEGVVHGSSRNGSYQPGEPRYASNRR